ALLFQREPSRAMVARVRRMSAPPAIAARAGSQRPARGAVWHWCLLLAAILMTVGGAYAGYEFTRSHWGRAPNRAEDAVQRQKPEAERKGREDAARRKADLDAERARKEQRIADEAAARRRAEAEETKREERRRIAARGATPPPVARPPLAEPGEPHAH